MVFPRFQWGLRDRCQTLQKLRHRRSSRCLRSSDAGPLDVYEVARCQNWLSKLTFPVCRMDFPYAQHEFQELRGRCGRSRPFFSQVWIGWNLQIFAQCAMVMGIFRLFVLVLLAFRYASPVCGAKERTRTRLLLNQSIIGLTRASTSSTLIHTLRLGEASIHETQSMNEHHASPCRDTKAIKKFRKHLPIFLI